MSLLSVPGGGIGARGSNDMARPVAAARAPGTDPEERSMVDYGKYRALSFDCYGTLIDWESGILKAARDWIDGSNGKIDDAAFMTAFGALERQEQSAAPGTLYPDILRSVLHRIGAEAGIPVSDAQARAFGASVGDWPAFGDSHRALAALRQRFKLIILSNVDRASFARSNARLDIAFDHIITAQDAGSYKPDPRNFEVLLKDTAALGIAKEELLHVGESMNHDVVPANRMDIDVVWIDRGRDSGRPRASGALPKDATPPAEFTTLAEFMTMADFAAAAIG